MLNTEVKEKKVNSFYNNWKLVMVSLKVTV